MKRQQTQQNGAKTNNYTMLTACVLPGNSGPLCPAGWESVGYTPPGSCTLGNAPGDGPMDTWKQYGYNRVCKRKVPTSGDLAVDCCSDLFGISGSLECRARGFQPYSWTCNNVMQEKCNTLVQPDPYGPEWNGAPFGQDTPIFNACKGQAVRPPPAKKAGCLDEFCINYLRNAPNNTFYSRHDYQDYGHYFPAHSYTTPAFSGTFGYEPMRKPYTVWNDYKEKNQSNFCQQFPNQCARGTLNDVHF